MHLGGLFILCRLHYSTFTLFFIGEIFRWFKNVAKADGSFTYNLIEIPMVPKETTPPTLKQHALCTVHVCNTYSLIYLYLFTYTSFIINKEHMHTIMFRFVGKVKDLRAAIDAAIDASQGIVPRA